jgi:hypothetical protein
MVFSTNLEPKELAEEAFLRRIQNKVYVGAVDAEVFSGIFKRIVAGKNLQCKADSAEVLRRLCIDLGGKELRACYPADILNILISICRYHELPVEISRANLEKAATLYFTKTMTMQQEPP